MEVTVEVSEAAEEETVAASEVAEEEASAAEEAPASATKTRPERKALFQASRELENNFDFSFLIRSLLYN